MEERITVRQWGKNYLSGEYDAQDIDTQINAGWHDWFCADITLYARLKKMGDLICSINNDFLLDNFYVRFMNCCPASDDPFYDEMRFEPLDEGLRDDLYFGVCFDDKRRNAKYSIFTARNGYDVEFKTDRRRDVITFLNNWGHHGMYV